MALTGWWSRHNRFLAGLCGTDWVASGKFQRMSGGRARSSMAIVSSTPTGAIAANWEQGHWLPAGLGRRRAETITALLD